MFFFELPDAVPQEIYQSHMVVAANASTSSSKATVRKMTYGVCELFYPYDGDLSENSYIRALGPNGYMTYFLSPKIQRILDTPGAGAGGIDWDWYDRWEDSFSITVLRQPQHGKVVVDNKGYLPDKGYFGKDRIDLLVEGKDDLGRSIAMTLRYYINVLPREELHKIANSKIDVFNRYVKKYCGTTKREWRISENQTGDSSFLASLFGAQSVFNGFADLPGGAVAQTTGTGANSQITLNTNATGYGWFIDYTPYLNEKYLPASNPYETRRRVGPACIQRWYPG